MKQLDKEAYRNYVEEYGKQTDGASDWQRYVLSAYGYFRSRLLVPGRSYEDESRGTLAIGGSAHVDLIDLDIWLSKQSGETRTEALDWIRDASLDQVSYWRGLGRASRSTIKRRRDKIVKDYTDSATDSTKRS